MAKRIEKQPPRHGRDDGPDVAPSAGPSGTAAADDWIIPGVPDLIVDERGRVLGRPRLAVAMCTATRTILGFRLGTDVDA